MGRARVDGAPLHPADGLPDLEPVTTDGEATDYAEETLPGTWQASSDTDGDVPNIECDDAAADAPTRQLSRDATLAAFSGDAARRLFDGVATSGKVSKQGPIMLGEEDRWSTMLAPVPLDARHLKALVETWIRSGVGCVVDLSDPQLSRPRQRRPTLFSKSPAADGDAEWTPPLYDDKNPISIKKVPVTVDRVHANGPQMSTPVFDRYLMKVGDKCISIYRANHRWPSGDACVSANLIAAAAERIKGRTRSAILCETGRDRSAMIAFAAELLDDAGREGLDCMTPESVHAALARFRKAAPDALSAAQFGNAWSAATTLGRIRAVAPYGCPWMPVTGEASSAVEKKIKDALPIMLAVVPFGSAFVRPSGLGGEHNRSTMVLSVRIRDGAGVASFRIRVSPDVDYGEKYDLWLHNDQDPIRLMAIEAVVDRVQEALRKTGALTAGDEVAPLRESAMGDAAALLEVVAGQSSFAAYTQQTEALAETLGLMCPVSFDLMDRPARARALDGSPHEAKHLMDAANLAALLATAPAQRKCPECREPLAGQQDATDIVLQRQAPMPFRWSMVPNILESKFTVAATGRDESFALLRQEAETRGDATLVLGQLRFSRHAGTVTLDIDCEKAPGHDQRSIRLYVLAGKINATFWPPGTAHFKGVLGSRFSGLNAAREPIWEPTGEGFRTLEELEEAFGIRLLRHDDAVVHEDQDSIDELYGAPDAGREDPPPMRRPPPE